MLLTGYLIWTNKDLNSLHIWNFMEINCLLLGFSTIIHTYLSFNSYPHEGFAPCVRIYCARVDNSWLSGEDGSFAGWTVPRQLRNYDKWYVFRHNLLITIISLSIRINLTHWCDRGYFKHDCTRQQIQMLVPEHLYFSFLNSENGLHHFS